jgi:hypothetical protein
VLYSGLHEKSCSAPQGQQLQRQHQQACRGGFPLLSQLLDCQAVLQRTAAANVVRSGQDNRTGWVQQEPRQQQQLQQQQQRAGGLHHGGAWQAGGRKRAHER